MTATVACFGIVVADRVYRVETLPSGEGKHTAAEYAETGGGIAGTAAVAVAALGGRALFCGAVGNDAAGAFLHGEMARLGVDLRAAQRLAGRTPSAAALVDRHGERCLVVDPGTLRPEPPSPATLAGAGAVLVDHRFPRAGAALLRAMEGVPRVLDGEGGNPAELLKLAGLAEFPVFSRAGLQIATGEADPAAGLRSLRLPRAVAAGVTLGEAGSLWLEGGVRGSGVPEGTGPASERLQTVPAVPVAVRDTTGCGDVFHGAFALALAEGRGWREAARFASAAAALKGRNGRGWSGMPGRAEVEQAAGAHG